MDTIKDNDGKTSAVRVGMFVCILSACAMAALAIWKDRDLIDVTILVTPFLITGMGGKVAQKKFENDAKGDIG